MATPGGEAGTDESAGQDSQAEQEGALLGMDEGATPDRVLAAGDPVPEVEQFSVSGFVAAGTPLSPAFVSFGRGDVESGQEREALGRMEVDGDARFGPATVALGDATRFWFRLEGGGFVVEEVVLPRPEADATVEVELVGETGETLYFYVYDADTEEPLPAAEVRVTWQSDGRAITVEGEGRPDAYFLAHGVAPGEPKAFASCEGYAPQEAEFVVPADEPFTHPFAMRAAGGVTGRVHHRGEPVADFGIALCPQGRRPESSVVRFSGRADGTFELGELARDTYEVSAFAEGYGQASSASIEVRAGEATHVEIELPPPIVAHGRVVDQDTGEPIAGARIQLFASVQGMAVAPTGEPASTDLDGRFQLSGFSQARLEYDVSAAGYGRIRNSAIGELGRTLELGTIGLTPAQSLTLRLLSEGTFDGSDYVAYTLDSDTIPRTRFAASGELRLPAVGPGTITVALLRPDLWATTVRHTLRRGSGEWILPIPLDGPCALEIEVVFVAESGLPEGGTLLLEQRSVGGDYLRYAHVVPEVGSISGRLPCGEYEAYLLGRERAIVARETIHLNAEEETFARIEVALPLSIAVVDRAGEPVAGAHVTIGSVGGASTVACNTDANGMGTVPSRGAATELVAMVQHPELGTACGLPVSLSGALGEVVELVFDPRETLEFVVMDGEQPVPNVECSLLDPNFSIPAAFDFPTSDAAGLVRFERVAEGSYEVHGGRLGYVPFVEVLTTTTERQVVRIQRNANPPND